MEKIIFVIAMLALVGCAPRPELPPVDELTQPTYSSADPATAPTAPTIDLAEVSRDVYLEVLGAEMPWLTRAEMLDFAGLACAELSTGADPITAAQNITGVRGQLDDMTAAGVVGGVIGSGYCEHWI